MLFLMSSCTEALFSLGDNELGIQPEDTVGVNKSKHMVHAFLLVFCQFCFMLLGLAGERDSCGATEIVCSSIATKPAEC